MQNSPITRLREAMNKDQIDGFYLPRTDNFLSEYLSPSDERLAWLYGFTGSAGTAIILADKALLSVDGRYITQAPMEVDSDIIDIVNIAEQSPIDWLITQGRDKPLIIGYDANLMRVSAFKQMQQQCAEHQITLKAMNGYIDDLWHDQPMEQPQKIFAVKPVIYDDDSASKRQKIAEIINQYDADYYLTITSDCQSWLLNLRGRDIPYNPVFKSFFLLTCHEAGHWFVDNNKLSDDVPLDSDINIYGFDEFAPFMQNLHGKKLLLDEKYMTQAIIDLCQAHDIKIIAIDDPIINAKALKSPAEIAAMRQANIYDGAAFCRILYDLCVHEDIIDEYDIINRLEHYRKIYDDYVGQSFETISGSGAHGAIIHYRVSDDSNRQPQYGELILLDAGGQYQCGTTDMTRTCFYGRTKGYMPTDIQKQQYTAVLQGHIDIAKAIFPNHVTGAQLDSLARRYLWQYGWDYDHGTGHGVGCFLNVHEDGAGIHPRFAKAIKSGMVISNEPGYYVPNQYGIRIENLILATPYKDNQIYFETLGLAPYDPILIDHDMLNDQQKQWLNDYHDMLCAQLKDYLPDDVFTWLKQQKA